MSAINYKTWVAVKPVNDEPTLLLGETEILKRQCKAITNISDRSNIQEYRLTIDAKPLDNGNVVDKNVIDTDDVEKTKIYASVKDITASFDYDSYVGIENLSTLQINNNIELNDHKIITPGAALKALRVPLKAIIENGEITSTQKIKNIGINTYFGESINLGEPSEDENEQNQSGNNDEGNSSSGNNQNQSGNNSDTSSESSILLKTRLSDLTLDELSQVANDLSDKGEESKYYEKVYNEWLGEDYHFGYRTVSTIDKDGYVTKNGTTQSPENQIICTLVGVCHDDLADGSGKKAGLSFLSIYSLPYLYPMFAINDTSEKNWANSFIRQRVLYNGNNQNEVCVWDTLPSDLKSKIKLVTKISNNGILNDSNVVSTEDYLWIPSIIELKSSNQSVKEGMTYDCFRIYDSALRNILPYVTWAAKNPISAVEELYYNGYQNNVSRPTLFDSSKYQNISKNYFSIIPDDADIAYYSLLSRTCYSTNEGGTTYANLAFYENGNELQSSFPIEHGECASVCFGFCI